MKFPIADLQDYMRRAVAQQREMVSVPGLTLFLHPHDALSFFNYAIPGEDWAVALDDALVRLRVEFAARGRRPRLEFIQEYAPQLGTALQVAGFAEEARQPLMVCTGDSFRPAPKVPGLSMEELDKTAPIDEMRTFLAIQRRGFDPKSTATATEDEARRFSQTLGAGRAFVAHHSDALSSAPVAAVMYSTPLQVGCQGCWVTEITGLATLAPYRRRGIATALTGHAVQSAFEQGVDVVCLVAADENAGRIYERVGFFRRATMLAYWDGSEKERPCQSMDS